jgi:Family of unknown function (DUF6339)
MKLQFLSKKMIQRLQDGAGANHSKYGPKNEWLSELAGGERFEYESRFIVEPPPILNLSDKPADDAENAQRIHSWLRNITPSVAMELRLWAHLTHNVFSEYMYMRWPPKDANIVHRRYLFEGNSFAALSRNGISRLWWAAYLTRDENRPNQFELTDTLFLRQDIQVAVLERAMGKCRGVRVALLDYIRNNQSWLSEEAFGKRIQILARELNLLGGAAILDAIPKADLTAYLEKIGASIGGK